MRTCPACRTDITEATARFCPNCGAPLGTAPTSPYGSAKPTNTFGDVYDQTGSASGANDCANAFSQNGNGYRKNAGAFTQNGGFPQNADIPTQRTGGFGRSNSPYGIRTQPPFTQYTNYPPTYHPPAAAQPSGALAIMALLFSLFFIGIVGFILGIVGLTTYPKGSGYRSMCKASVIIPVAEMVLMIVMIVILFSLGL